MKIRRATFYDLDDLYDLNVALRNHERTKWALTEEPYPYQPLDEADKLHFALERVPLLTNPSINYSVAENSSGLLVGYLLCSHYTRPVGAPTMVCNVHEFFVEPGLRTKEPDRVSKLLADEVKQWARSLACSHVEISCIAAEAQVAFWQARGYKPFKVFMQRELD